MASIDQRKSDTGAVTYRVRVRLRGRPTETATFARLTDAKRWAQSTETAIREGRHFKTAEAKRHTLADLIDRYEREVIPTKPKNGKNTSQHLAWWRKRLGAYALADVTASLIVEARNALLSMPTRRKKLPAPATVVRYLASLSHAFTVAVNEWEWLDDSPMRKVKKPVEARGRERFLSDVERERLLVACTASTSRYLYAVSCWRSRPACDAVKSTSCAGRKLTFSVGESCCSRRRTTRRAACRYMGSRLSS